MKADTSPWQSGDSYASEVSVEGGRKSQKLSFLSGLLLPLARLTATNRHHTIGRMRNICELWSFELRPLTIRYMVLWAKRLRSLNSGIHEKKKNKKKTPYIGLRKISSKISFKGQPQKNNQRYLNATLVIWFLCFLNY